MWPATAFAAGCVDNSAPFTACGGFAQGLSPYGTIFRLNSTWADAYDPSIETSNPTVQKYLKIIVNTIRNHGLILMDGTSNSSSLELHVRGERGLDDNWKQTEAILRLTTGSGTATVGNWNLINNLEALDVSSLRFSATSNLVNPSLTWTRPERAIFRDLNTSTDLDYRDIAINPPTIGTTYGRYINLVGPLSINLAPYVWATGLVNNSDIGWTIRSGGGGITTSGVYASTTVVTPTITVVRAFANADPTVFTDIRILTYPPSAPASTCAPGPPPPSPTPPSAPAVNGGEWTAPA